MPKYGVIHTYLFMTNLLGIKMKRFGLASLVWSPSLQYASSDRNKQTCGSWTYRNNKIYPLLGLLHFLFTQFVGQSYVAVMFGLQILPPSLKWTFLDILHNNYPLSNRGLSTVPLPLFLSKQLLNDSFVYFYEGSRILPDQVKLKKNQRNSGTCTIFIKIKI